MIRRWPLPLLLVSLALTAAAAVDAHRTVQSQHALTARALREFSSFAAWSYGQHFENRMLVMLSEALGAVNHGEALHERPPVPEAKNLAHYLPYDTRCGCHRTRAGPRPAALFAFELDRGKLDIAVNTHSNPLEGWEVDRPPMAELPAGAIPDYSPAERKWIVDTITRRTRAASRPHRGFTLVLGGTENGPRRVIAYTLMPTTWGDTMVYGAEYAREDFEGVLREVLEHPSLLPTTFTARSRNPDVVVAKLTDRTGATWLDSDPGHASPYESRIVLDTLEGALTLSVSVRPEQASVLVFGGMPRSRLPFLLGILALAATLSVVAVLQLRRETELARMRSDFVANVSHELRTPLAQIRLFTETLRLGRARTPEQRDWSLGHIERETTRLGHLVENVLRFSRAGRPDVTHPEPVDVAAEVAAIIDDFAPLAASKRVTVAADLPPAGTAGVLLRPDALRRMLLNLLDNAVKYGPDGQTVRVSAAVRDGELRLTVEDEGPGVPVRERESVWLPFERGSAGGVAAGSGIGLTLVRELAEQHRGRSWVESGGGGRGARFVVAIPVGMAHTNGA